MGIFGESSCWLCGPRFGLAGACPPPLSRRTESRRTRPSQSESPLSFTPSLFCETVHVLRLAVPARAVARTPTFLSPGTEEGVGPRHALAQPTAAHATSL